MIQIWIFLNSFSSSLVILLCIPALHRLLIWRSEFLLFYLLQSVDELREIQWFPELLWSTRGPPIKCAWKGRERGREGESMPQRPWCGPSKRGAVTVWTSVNKLPTLGFRTTERVNNNVEGQALKESRWQIEKVIGQLEWSRVQSLSCVWLSVTPWTPWSSPGQHTGVGSLSLL